MAYSTGKVHIHARAVKVQFPSGVESGATSDDTENATDGDGSSRPRRVASCSTRSSKPGMPFYNHDLDKKALSRVIADCHI